MKVIKSLKDEQYYNDLYDRHTVEECRWHEQWFSKDDVKPDSENSPKSKALLEIKNEWKKVVGEVALCFRCGERYVSKSETIQKWMREDRLKDELLDNANSPRNIRCSECHSQMVCTEKELYWGDNEMVLFFFRCEKCNGMKALYDNGKEFEPIYKCSKCGNNAQATHSRKKNKITTKYNCSHCRFSKKDVLDLDKKTKKTKEVVDKNFDADRKRFCMSKEEGEKYIDGKANLIRATDSFKEMEEREKQKELYDEVSKIKKLNIAELEKQLVLALEKESYIRLEFLKPELGRIVVIEFTIQDATSGVHEHTRRMTLKKTISKTLIETNWKLVEDSISYRLGIISGRLRGFEYEEDIIEVVKSRRKKLEKKLHLQK